jgi:hypothetical protein
MKELKTFKNTKRESLCSFVDFGLRSRIPGQKNPANIDRGSSF